MPLSGREEQVRLVRYICRSPGQRACVLYTYDGRGSLVAGDVGFSQIRKGPLGRGPRPGLKDPEPGYASLSGQEDHSFAGDLRTCRLRAAGTCSIYAAMASRVAEKLYFGRCAGSGSWGLCGLRMSACWSVLPERTYEVLSARVIWIFVCGRILHGGVFFVRRQFLLILRT